MSTLRKLRSPGSYLKTTFAYRKILYHSVLSTLALITFLLFPRISEADITIRLSQKECYPGDLIELQIESRSEIFQTFETSFPKHADLHIVSQRKKPIQYRQGEYIQSEIWIMQAKTAGIIDLAGLKAQIHTRDETIETELPAVKLAVNAYTSLDLDGFSPEPLRLEETPKDFPFLPFGTLVSVLVLVTWIGLKVKHRSDASIPEIEPAQPLLSIRASLATGAIPEEEIESFLESSSISISPQEKAILERAIYGAKASPRLILEDLEGKGS